MANFFTVEEKVRRCIARHPDWDDKHIRESVGVRKEVVVRVKAELTGALKSTETKDSGIISLEKVRKKYDTISAIEKELALLEKGKLILETELAQRVCSTDRVRFRRAVENNEEMFKARRAKLKLDESAEPKWWWGCQEDISIAISWRDS